MATSEKYQENSSIVIKSRPISSSSNLHHDCQYLAGAV